MYLYKYALDIDISLAKVEIDCEINKLQSKSYDYANVWVNSEELQWN